MLPNTKEEWENDNGKSVLVKCINGTKPKDNMMEDNGTDAKNGTVFQDSLIGEHFFISWTFHTFLQNLNFYLQTMMQVVRDLVMIYLLMMEKITVPMISSLSKLHLRVKTPMI